MHSFFCIGMADHTVNLIYENTNNNIEWMTEKLLFSIRSVTYSFIYCSVIFSLYTYITSGLDNDSFRQIYPASWVIFL